ncbi:MAG: hypothetical protein ABIG84_03230 [archaeon]
MTFATLTLRAVKLTAHWRSNGYVIQTDTCDDSWTLGASEKQQGHPTNIWEYSRDTEIKKTFTYAGYIISLITSLYLLLILTNAPKTTSSPAQEKPTHPP